MRLQYRRALSYFMLATFASISLLGEGLHWLTPETGHHHHHHHRHGVGVITHDARHDDHDFHLVSHARASTNRTGCRKTTASALLFVSDNDVDAHTCKICEYLFQAVSQPIEVAAPIEWQPLVVAVPSLPQPIFSPTTLGPQAARGPPSLV